MACMSHRIRERTNAHDAAGNSTAFGKGLATVSCTGIISTVWSFCELCRHQNS
uniref:Uncharacterized protein n=1 Tax=Helianthus annuus TaxID=4232 RepID=A0A251SKJ1_HELAN